MKIGIAGVGGIGSNVARHLAQAKVSMVKIVDFDCVETANLNRQFYRTDQVGCKKTVSLEANLHAIYPDMVIERVDKKITSENVVSIFQDCPIVVEGFDHPHLKKMLIEKLAGADKKIVSASGIAGRNLDTVIIKKFGNCHIAGDFSSDQDRHPLFPPKVALVAAVMAGIVLDQMEKLKK